MKKINVKKLRDFMLESRREIRDVAKAVGISTATLSNLLRRGGQVRIVTIAKLAKALNVSPYEIIDDETI